MTPPSALGYGLVPGLCAARLRMTVNGAFRAGVERRAWSLIAVVLACGGMLAGYRLARAGMQDGPPGAASLQPIVTGSLGMLAAFTAVTAITFTLGSCYFARDLDGLLASPAPPRALLLSRVLVQLATGLAVGTVLVTPPLAAYAVATGRPLTLPLVGLSVLAMAAVPLAAGTALTIGIVRLVPARLVRDAGGLVVTLAVFSVTAINLFLRGPDGLTGSTGQLDPSQRSGIAGSLWLPTGWAAHAVVAAMDGRTAAALGWTAALLAAAVATLLAVPAICERAWVVGWQNGGEASTGGRRRAGRRAPLRARARPAWRSIALKDLREVRRDPAQLGQLILPLALFAVYIAAPQGIGGGVEHSHLPLWFGPLLVAAFASLFAASGVALRGVGAEGGRIWLLRSAPLEVGQVLRAKVVAGSLVAVGVALGLLAVGVVRTRMAPLDALLAATRLTVVVVGLCALAVGMGAVRPRLDWTDPRRAVGIGLSFGFLIAGAGYLGLCFVVMGVPYAGGNATTLRVAVADGVLAVVVAVTVAISLAAGAARLRTLEL